MYNTVIQQILTLCYAHKSSYQLSPYSAIVIILSLFPWLIILLFKYMRIVTVVYYVWRDSRSYFNCLFQFSCFPKFGAFFRFIYLFSNFYTQYRAWTHNPEVKSCMLFQLSQPGTLTPNFNNKTIGYDNKIKQ